MITKGMLLRAQTKTKNDVFGDVTWEVAEVGLPFRSKAGSSMEGVKLVMLGGTGPSARKGYTVIDSESNIQNQIASKIVTIVPPEKKFSIEEYYADKKQDGKRRPAMGCMEI